MGFDLNLSPEQRQILDTAATLLDEAYPLARLREARMDTLAPLAAFGALALAVPDGEGGTGLTVVEEALVHTLLGRHCVTPRALVVPLAAAVAHQAGLSALSAELLGLDQAVCPALLHQQGLMLLDPAGAALALVFEERALALVEVGQATPVSGLGRSMAVALAPVPVTVLARTRDPSCTMRADLLVSSQLLGVAEAARDLAVAYAGLRRQFGRPIGTFQAVKHHAANMAVAAEMLSAQRDMAALALAEGRLDAAFQVSALRRLAGRTALANARQCVQLHGGIGFSAEADAHHLVKQAHALSALGAAQAILDLDAPMAPSRPAVERT